MKSEKRIKQRIERLKETIKREDKKEYNNNFDNILHWQNMIFLLEWVLQED